MAVKMEEKSIIAYIYVLAANYGIIPLFESHVKTCCFESLFPSNYFMSVLHSIFFERQSPALDRHAR